MKNLKYITIIIVLAVLSACEDYLETVPYSFTSPENFYQTEKEAEMALNGVYNVLTAGNVQGTGNQSTYSRNLMFMLNGANDEALVRDGFNNVDYSVWGNGGFTAQSNFLNESWFFLYAGINRANYLIENIQDIDDFTIDHFRKELWLPELSNRLTLDTWKSSGCTPMAEKAIEKLKLKRKQKCLEDIIICY